MDNSMNNIEEMREILLTHARHPKRVGEMADANGTGHCHNPMCGDKVSVSLIIEDKKVKTIRILPSGCSISAASASLMTETVEGMSLSDLENTIKDVHTAFTPGSEHGPFPENLKQLIPLKRIKENPLKIPCVLIAWIATKEALKNYHNKEQVCLV